MSLATFHPKKLSVFAALSFADLLLTYQLLQKTGGSVYESNPIANAWLVSYGWAGLVVFKIVSITVLVSVAGVLSLRQPRLAGEVITFACVAVGGVVLYSCTLVNWLRPISDTPIRASGNELAVQTVPFGRQVLMTRIPSKRTIRRKVDVDAGLTPAIKTALVSKEAPRTNSLSTSSLGAQWRLILLTICNPSAANHDSAKSASVAEARPVRPSLPAVPVSLTSN